MVVRRGERADAMYFIVSGEVEVELKEGHHPRLKDGDFFGEIAILTDEKRTATVRAVKDTQLLMLQAHDVERLIDRVPEIGARMRRVAEDRAPQRVATAAERPRRKRSPSPKTRSGGDAA